MIRNQHFLAASVLSLAVPLASGQSTCLDERVDLLGFPASIPSGHGTDVSLHDGRLLVGAPLLERAVLYRGHGMSWDIEITLKPPALEDDYGESVALSSNRAVVGAPDTTGPSAGAAYVFRKAGTAWPLEAKLTPSQSQPGDRFGSSLALAGTTLVVGVLRAPPVGGAAHVFERSSTDWNEVQVIDMPGPANGFGAKVELANERLFVSAPSEPIDGIPRGVVYVFEKVGASWQQTDRLVPSQPTAIGFGSALSAYEDSVAVGAPAGRTISVFDHTSNGWKEVALFEPERSLFGRSLELFRDLLAIGSNVSAGSVHVYSRRFGPWSERFDVVTPSAPAKFGTALSADGPNLVVGAPQFDGRGAAFVYPYLPEVNAIAYCKGKKHSGGCRPVIDAQGCASAVASTGFEVRVNDLLNDTAALLLYGVSGRAATPFQGGTLCVAPPLSRTPPQSTGGSASPERDCTGTFRLDMNAFAAGALGGHPIPQLSMPDTVVYCQVWGRDGQDAFGSTLSEALEYVIAP